MIMMDPSLSREEKMRHQLLFLHMWSEAIYHLSVTLLELV